MEKGDGAQGTNEVRRRNLFILWPKKILNAILIQSQIPDFYSLKFKAEAG